MKGLSCKWGLTAPTFMWEVGTEHMEELYEVREAGEKKLRGVFSCFLCVDLALFLRVLF